MTPKQNMNNTFTSMYNVNPNSSATQHVNAQAPVSPSYKSFMKLRLCCQLQTSLNPNKIMPFDHFILFMYVVYVCIYVHVCNRVQPYDL